MSILKIIFWICLFLIFWAMIGYKLSLNFLSKILKNKKLEKNYSYKPTVSVMIVAHNEEKVILDKLNNIINNDYPKEKIEYLVTSDASTDATNAIVEQYIMDHPDINLYLHRTIEHKGKTNAQNEGQKITSGEILVMTDANAMFERDAISELIACFTDPQIAYVTGKLVYQNVDNSTASAENVYWEDDLKQRKIESDIKTITAGNGAIYACRNSEYFDFEPKKCHDFKMPYYYAQKHMRALYNPDARAYEKAGETDFDEYKRKVRMNRDILSNLKDGIKCLNIFKYGWFSYFFFGHRTSRYMLWFNHALLLVLSSILINQHWVYCAAFIGQVIFYLVAFINSGLKINKYFNMVSHYSMTLIAQWHGVYNVITGRTKATWDKAESTR